MIIDGKNAIMGRLSSMAAKKLLAGESVVVVNAEKVIITGDPHTIVDKYLERRRRGSPQHGPFFPKQPDKIVQRSIRGMLPYKTPKGRTAMKKLRICVGVPEAYSSEKKDSLAVKSVRSNFISVGDLAKTLGWQK
jgi:large subunit ribosomal protein L13